tara:strand:+ start:6136 stop:6330 length:195 start_codon:yes stop_codon:yes gene_type:complete
MSCTKCGKKFTCGCQKTKLPSGQVVCKKCKKGTSAPPSKISAPGIRRNEVLKRNERARTVNKKN